MKKKVLIIGAGKMGIAHLEALLSINFLEICVWAPSNRAKEYIVNKNVNFISGSLEKSIKMISPTHVILACPAETLFKTLLLVIKCGIKNILTEKPMCLYLNEADIILKNVEREKLNLIVGYNRRYYSSLRTALLHIKNSGEKIESISFEFNELFKSINGPKNTNKEVKKKWILSNSMHVIDMAFSPVGLPLYEKSFFMKSGNNLKWHPDGNIFYGSGITEKKIPFSYHSNWVSPGRWGVEWMTKSFRYIFKPLETLTVMKRFDYDINNVDLVDDFDLKFKPGVILQNKYFLEGQNSYSVTPYYARKLIYLSNIIGGYNE